LENQTTSEPRRDSGPYAQSRADFVSCLHVCGDANSQSDSHAPQSAALTRVEENLFILNGRESGNRSGIDPRLTPFPSTIVQFLLEKTPRQTPRVKISIPREIKRRIAK
jgi:hypothetical protein